MSAKEHEMHCRGQLMLIERMLGIVPHLTRKYAEMEREMRRRRKRKLGKRRPPDLGLMPSPSTTGVRRVRPFQHSPNRVLQEIHIWAPVNRWSTWCFNSCAAHAPARILCWICRRMEAAALRVPKAWPSWLARTTVLSCKLPLLKQTGTRGSRDVSPVTRMAR